MAPGLFALKDPDPNKNSAHPDPYLLSFKEDLDSVQMDPELSSVELNLTTELSVTVKSIFGYRNIWTSEKLLKNFWKI